MDEIFAGIKSFLGSGKAGGLKTPCYVIDEKKLGANGKVLASVISRTGCRILLAQKAFSNYDFYPLLENHISGTEASGLFEARLGKEEMPGKEVHVFCAAYRDDEFGELLNYADHIVFNSVNQLKKFGGLAKQNGKSVGLRINPECSTQEGHEIYDPCAKGSRLGVTRSVWDKEMTGEAFEFLDGLHFHTLCEQDSDALETTLRAVEEKFGDVLPKMKWLNMGGGHHITKADYGIARLERCINSAKEKWSVQVYLEPGEAVALKMPYTPPLLDACHDDSKPYRYRLGGPTCLSGDIIGDYTFDRELSIGDLLVFGDMAIYTTCKNNTFNGMPLPDIYRLKEDGDIEKLTDFGYGDFKHRLGR